MRLRWPSLRSGLRTPTVLNITLGVLVLAGVFLSYRLVTASATTTPTTGAGASRTVTVTEGPVVSTVSASGTVQSATTAAADFATSGTVTSIAVKVGDTVTKDQVLATVDPTDAQAQLDTARANLTAAQASLTRARTGGDDATIAAAQAQVTSARAAVDEASRGVAGTTLKAPMAGTVTAINGSVGASSGSSSSSGSSQGQGQGQGSTTTTTTSGFVQLADLGSMQVSASFAEADATKLKAGLTGTVTWAALTGTTAAATISTIAPTATTANGVNSYAVTVALTQTPAGVRMGQTVTVQVTVAQVENAIRVPSAAVRTVGNRHAVGVLVGGAPQARSVEVGILGDTFTQVTSGLAVGEQVVIVVATTTAGTNNFPGGGFGGGGGAGGGAGPGAGTGRGGTGR